MGMFIRKIGEYYRTKHHFSDDKVQRIEYSLKATWNELSKVLIYSLFFFFTGNWKTFALVYICLISIRLFFGGIHCGSYTSCLIISFVYLCICVFCPSIIRIPPSVLFSLSGLSVIFALLFAPILPKVRSLKTRKQFWILKVFSVTSTVLWILIAYLYRETSVVSSNLLWTIILANYQLVFPYWSYLKERRKRHGEHRNNCW